MLLLLLLLLVLLLLLDRRRRRHQRPLVPVPPSPAPPAAAAAARAALRAVADARGRAAARRRHLLDPAPELGDYLVLGLVLWRGEARQVWREEGVSVHVVSGNFFLAGLVWRDIQSRVLLFSLWPNPFLLVVVRLQLDVSARIKVPAVLLYPTW